MKTHLHARKSTQRGIIIIWVVIAIICIGGLIFIVERIISAVHHIDERRQRQQTNDPPEFGWIPALYQISGDIVNVEVVPSDSVLAAAALLPMTMTSTDLVHWVEIEDDRDLWIITREAAGHKDAPPVQFFRR